ncbi:hypothetical protein FHW83_004745 [Duganella sp. SG902]|uniref:hypothetical protein n=1 Tax=Duganella sp. SG902 TaxID=2587016 RepID=UPI00159E1369|nr:hypothetical protein [Duganella sp. SG902]NVM78914.1 hypothetical protein [Duganella sp. SG902]
MQTINTPDQLFHDGDPFNGVKGTVVTAAWLNAVQQEIVGVISDAGIALDSSRTDQLLNAIKAAASKVANSAVTVQVSAGVTILTQAQYSAPFIVITGALTANVSLIFPRNIGKWDVINATTGNYTVSCFATNGGGVVISPGVVDGIVCDGSDIKYEAGDAATRAAVQKNSLVYATGGGTANAQTASFLPAVADLTDGMTLYYQASVANNAATTFAPNGLSPAPILGGFHLPLQGGEIVAGGKVALMWHAGLASWILTSSTGGGVQVGTASRAYHAVNLGTVQNLIAGAGPTYCNGARTLVAGQVYLVDSTGGTFTLTLPTPTKGTIVTFIDVTNNWGTTNWTLGRNGKTIMGFSADLTIDLSDRQFSIWFNGNDWRLV